MTVPQISVVVPFYDIEDLLGDCLQSIAAQTFADLEVIMVDDGSTDGSAAVAQRMAAADPRFRLIRVPNGGPGYARNRGVEQASGEFLAFVDADDMLPSHAYEKLHDTLVKSGSDFVSGNVLRIGPSGMHQSALHSKAIKGRSIGTHVSKTPQLLYDISVWNKLFRKAFWDRAGLTIPEGMVWEDLQIMTRAHVLARAVDVIPDPIYYWRERGKGALSITQSRTDISNFRDRITALLAIDRFLAGNASAKLLRQHQRKALDNDLWLYVCDLYRTSDSYRAEFVELAGQYLDQVDKRVMAKLPSTHKLAFYLVRRRALDRLIEFNRWQTGQPVRTIPVLRKHGRLRADLPFLGDRSAGVPVRIYRPYWRELDPFVRVEGLSWRGNRLVITGCAYVPSIAITKRRHTSKIIVLRPRGRRRPPIVLPARSFQHPDATAWSQQERYSYDWAGFECEISSRWFRVAARWLTGDWDAFILVRGRGVWRLARVHTPMIGPAERPEYLEVAPGMRFGANWVGRQLHVGVRSTPAVLRGAGYADGRLTIDVDIDLAGPGTAADLVLAWSKGATTRRFAGSVERRDGGHARLRAVLPVAGLTPVAEIPADAAAALGPAGAAGPEPGEAAALDSAEAAAPEPGEAATADSAEAAVPEASEPAAAEEAGPAAAAADEPVQWDLYVEPAGQRRLAVTFPAGLAEFRYPSGERELAVERTRTGNAAITAGGLRPVIDENMWGQDGRLTLRGSYPAPEGYEYEAVLRRHSSTDRHVVAMSRDGERFSIDIDVARMPSYGQLLPLRDGRWDIFVRRAGAADGEMVSPSYAHARLAQVAGDKVGSWPKDYKFTTAGYDAPVIVAKPVLKLSETGRFQRKLLRSAYYPLQQRLPLRDAVVFVSWKGKQCGDNPLGIAAELRRRGDGREHIWAVNDWAVPAPDNARVVLRGTEAYYEALARSRYIIANDDMEASFSKRDGQVYVQTWHGTPLKKIGFDIERPQFISGTSYFDHLASDVAKWDLLLSPNPFSTQIMRRAFRYDGEICDSGYPRNDVLCSGDAPRVAARVRRRLGLPDGKRVVLYAPTWRDNQYYASGRYRFDFRLDLERAWQELGDDHVVLFRGHHHMADDVPAGGRPGFAFNVTTYPDISELLLVSDVLVTDYSSVMFDFAPTGRPMLFFTYDLDLYRDNLRGFYFDFEAEAPGPLLATSEEVLAAIGNIDSAAGRYHAAYQKFTEKFCPLDDGKAGARACDRIFGS
jgi:CDP-glycerol glycerophosphotransferase